MADNTDIKDSEKDAEKLKQDVVSLDLPDVKDIPGQENITVPNMKEMADATISSDDEEGIGLFNDEEDDDVSNERIGSAQKLNEDDLIINEDEDAVETALDEEDEAEDDDELTITDDSVDEDADVTEDEKIALERSADDVDTLDNEDLYAAELDDTDLDGEKLNESINVSGKDLDVPGAEDDDADEDLGEEDEENNEYSLGDNE